MGVAPPPAAVDTPPRVLRFYVAGDTVWEPLLAIADMAGGIWPGRARRAAIALAGRVEDQDITVELLRDVAVIMGEYPPHQDIIASTMLIEKLAEQEDRPWATWRTHDTPITPRGLARLLDPLDIHVGQYQRSRARTSAGIVAPPSMTPEPGICLRKRDCGTNPMKPGLNRTFHPGLDARQSRL